MTSKVNSFSSLCKGLYQPSLEKAWIVFGAKKNIIIVRYSTSGFTSPPGAMYAELGKCYREELKTYAQIIFECCREAYAASHTNYQPSDFAKELQEAFAVELKRVLASGEGEFTQYNAQFKIPSYQLLIEHFRHDVESEGRRVARLYASKVEAYCRSVATTHNVENPLELKPNFFGLGIDLKRIWPWIKKKLRK